MLKKCKTVQDVFDLVKNICFEYFKKDQAGLMLGFADLGSYPNGWFGAYYSLNANCIVLNKKPLKHVPKKLQKGYLFHLILHEYIHSLGFIDENQTRELAYEVSSKYFGSDHFITKISTGVEKFFPGLLQGDYEPPHDLHIEFLTGIDRKNTDYIA